MQVCSSRAKLPLVLTRTRIRHKKCDENKPACSQCSSTGRCCEFTANYMSTAISNPTTPRIIPIPKPQTGAELLPSHLSSCERKCSDIEASHFDYFRLVVAKTFALALGSEPLEQLLLLTVHTEPSIYHASLAVSALSRSNSSPLQAWDDAWNSGSAIEYAFVHYGLAIRSLNEQLKGSIQGAAEIAVLASILFIYIEAFQPLKQLDVLPRSISDHLHGALVIVNSFKSLSRTMDSLETALHHIRYQINGFHNFLA